MGQENIPQTVDKVLDDIAAKREATMGKAEQPQDKGADSPKKEFKEITLKFGKGCVGEEFKGKDGKDYKEILVPNPDKNDHRPWQTFVVKSNHVHENQFGNTTYTVKVHFSKDTNKTFKDRVQKLIINECLEKNQK